MFKGQLCHCMTRKSYTYEFYMQQCLVLSINKAKADQCALELESLAANDFDVSSANFHLANNFFKSIVYVHGFLCTDPFFRLQFCLSLLSCENFVEQRFLALWYEKNKTAWKLHGKTQQWLSIQM